MSSFEVRFQLRLHSARANFHCPTLIMIPVSIATVSITRKRAQLAARSSRISKFDVLGVAGRYIEIVEFRRQLASEPVLGQKVFAVETYIITQRIRNQPARHIVAPGNTCKTEGPSAIMSGATYWEQLVGDATGSCVEHALVERAFVAPVW